jgi:outer membrane protein OmpA-like peptidoglycan-associated protein
LIAIGAGVIISGSTIRIRYTGTETNTGVGVGSSAGLPVSITKGKKDMKKEFIVLVLVLSIVSCAGMSQRQKTGTAVGTAGGAGVGALIGGAYGGNTGAWIGGLIGAGLGGLTGYQVGSYMDRQEAELNAALEESRANNTASIERDRENTDVLLATFKGDVFFDFDSATLKPGAYAEIDRVVPVLKKYNQTAIQVEGYTDQIGTEAYNQRLSEQRAEAVKNALIQRGIDPTRIRAIGLGESQPISSDNAMNRRVTLRIIPLVKEG